MEAKVKKFRVHFNRVNMQRGSSKVWTVHNSDACYQVENVVIKVPIQTVYKPQGHQPRAYFSGYGRVVIRGTTAYLEAK